MIWTYLHTFEIILWCFMAFSVAYVAFFALISLFYEKDDILKQFGARIYSRKNKFLILYPAYNEDRVIIHSVEKFLLQDYPSDLYRVVVISDHMRPETNEYLTKLPITLLTPTFEKSSKAKAMQYAMEQVEEKFDFVVVMDADNVVRSEFLQQLNVLYRIGYVFQL